jgi:hypothetical protein
VEAELKCPELRRRRDLDLLESWHRRYGYYAIWSYLPDV